MLKKTGSSFLRHASYLAKAKSGPIGQSFQTIFLFPMAMQKEKKRKKKKNEIITWFSFEYRRQWHLKLSRKLFRKKTHVEDWKTIGLLEH